jgi:hypothetical protein
MNYDAQMGCYLEDANGEHCVFDDDDRIPLGDCVVAAKLFVENKTRKDCPYYRIIGDNRCGDKPDSHSC